MASEPQADRIRLIVEPEDEEATISEPGGERVPQSRPEDMIDLSRLEDDPDYEFEDEEETPRRRRLLPVGLAAIALAGFGAIAWYGYQGMIGGSGDEMIPLIQADAGPLKTRPAAPGGMEVPYRDKLVLNEIAPDPDKPQVERLLPPPEVPKPPLAQSQQASQAPAPTKPAATGAPATVPKVAAPEPLAAAAGPAVSRPKDLGAKDLAPKDLAPKDLAPKDLAPKDLASKNLGTKDLGPKAGPAVVPAKPARAARAPKAAAPRPTQTAAVAGGYLIQFASLKDKSLVDGEWARLQKAFPDLLAGKKLVTQSADLGGRGVFHRVRTGHFADRESAAALCRAIAARKQACIVVKP